jgi:GNAT superfamily N-acetyltransferase
VRGVRIVTKANTPFGAQIVPYRRLGVRDVQRVVDYVRSRVTGPIVTSALTTIEQDGFREAGFTEREALHLLRHPLLDVHDHREPAGLRSGRRSDLSRVLEIDEASFDSFWRLDRDSFNSARRATPVNYYRVATIEREVVGYAITGRAGRSAFLQRLGVDPSVRGQGVGTQLVSDSLRWAQREGCASMLVNTQVVNENARRLYQRVGFVLDREQLKVLEWAQ